VTQSRSLVSAQRIATFAATVQENLQRRQKGRKVKDQGQRKTGSDSSTRPATSQSRRILGGHSSKVSARQLGSRKSALGNLGNIGTQVSSFPLCDVHCPEKGRCSFDSPAVANETHGLRETPSSLDPRNVCLDRWFWFRIRFLDFALSCQSVWNRPSAAARVSDSDNQRGLAVPLRIFQIIRAHPYCRNSRDKSPGFCAFEPPGSRIVIWAEEQLSPP